MRFAHPFFHHRADLPPECTPRRVKLTGSTGLFRYLSPLSRPDHSGSPRIHSPSEPAPAPKWLERSLIALAVALAAFTVLHQPKPFASSSQRPAIATTPPRPAPYATASHRADPISPAAPSAHPSRPAATGLPRDVTIARDLSVTVEYGVVDLHKGQPVQLVDQTDFGYYAVYEDYLLPLKDGDFQ